ncbi:L-aspartate oxidase [Actinoalloteichus hymeniacidonis]|uniref:L-aspartate oxidase n=1 Tax=Actinoalloteichus hymeniacidonis TaxID=340345 RepID=A0AAC9MXY3_9PSEU|nr:L-aspartate oxidase [Actinoalloteichus hymeniacidonis]AOS62745.1 L-aspartate oxidase [Actinoalloteichus hymeniacidonis]MBB5909224.1 L-aspartate oxidase [Actinoalloteichus hymeniacidonis]
MTARWESEADVLVVGTGVAGLTAALHAQRLGLRVLVVTKGAAEDGNTRWAQGGVAVVLDDRDPSADSVDRHVADTLTAGAGLCDEAAVRGVIGAGPDAVTELIGLGARFDAASDGGGLARTREGGHSAYRVIHAGGDATGAEVSRALLAAGRDGRIAILEHHVAVEALRTPTGAVAGLLVLDPEGGTGLLRAPAVVLATGGAGQLYQATSNPDGATGDGLALALRAGAVVSDLEFVQFHPTVLYSGPADRGRRPLITEAVRGEGAVLIDATGSRVMAGVHPMADLAPRDVVSAAITRRLAEAPGGVDDHVYLDATGLAGPAFRRRFPTVFAACQAVGIDPATDPIPVAPAAHFACGGIVASTHGRTGVVGLYAVGEVARTGLHGANRLASNSLLEGLVTGRRVAEAVAEDRAACLLGGPCAEIDPVLPAEAVADRPVLQRAMSRYAAIGRDAEGLATATTTLDACTVVRPLRTPDLVADAALALVARLSLLAASNRTESRGCHVRHDHPERDDRIWRRSLLTRLDVAGQPILVEQTSLKGVA